MEWKWMTFGEMTGETLYEILRLRQDVFVLEQRCLYPELDGLDQAALHLVGRDESGRLAAYCRVVPPGARYEEPSIGRVVTAAEARGKGLGKALFAEAMRKCGEVYPGRAIRIQAQQYLEGFYAGFGFRPVTQAYEEAGIMHVEMVL